MKFLPMRGCFRNSSARFAAALLPALIAAAPAAGRDWNEIRASGTLRVLIDGAPESVSLERQMGPEHYERSLLLAFAAKNRLRIKFVPHPDLRKMLAEVGKSGDLAASTLTATPERAKTHAFSLPYAYSREQLVVSTRKKSVRSPADLRNLSGAVLPGSVYRETLKRFLAAHPGFRRGTVTPPMGTFELLSKVAEGVYDYTILDDNYIDFYLTVRDNVKIIHTFPAPRPLVYLLPKSAVELRKRLNEFIRLRTPGKRFRADSADLPKIRQRKYLRILTRNNPFCYFLHRGVPQGFEYELAAMFARELGVLPVPVVPPRWSDMEKYLAEGKGDLIAANFTLTESRRRTPGVLFSEGYGGAVQVIVGRRNDRATGLKELAGRTVYVRNQSVFRPTLERLRRAGAKFRIRAVPDTLESDAILRRVAAGKYDLAAADDVLVDLLVAEGVPIRKICPVSERQSFVWVFRSANPELQRAANDFFRRRRKSAALNLLNRKYYNHSSAPSRPEPRFNRQTSGISPFDAYFIKYGRMFGINWCLLSAQAFQESRFNPKAQNRLGARGLMQIMPATARELGIPENALFDPETAIRGGAEYLHRQARRFPAAVAPGERDAFALASYNAGYGHVRDARELARQLRLSPDKWRGNVERTLKLLSLPEYAARARCGYCRASETIPYVNEIMTRAKLYSDHMHRSLPKAPQRH